MSSTASSDDDLDEYSYCRNNIIPAILPKLKSVTPLPDCSTQILLRYDSSSGLPLYRVLITPLGGQNETDGDSDILGSQSQTGDSAEDERSQTRIVEVSFDDILDYVSPFELERFENEQFRLDMEAEAAAKEAEREEEERLLLAAIRAESRKKRRGRPKKTVSSQQRSWPSSAMVTETEDMGDEGSGDTQDLEMEDVFEPVAENSSTLRSMLPFHESPKKHRGTNHAPATPGSIKRNVLSAVVIPPGPLESSRESSPVRLDQEDGDSFEESVASVEAPNATLFAVKTKVDATPRGNKRRRLSNGMDVSKLRNQINHAPVIAEYHPSDDDSSSDEEFHDAMEPLDANEAGDAAYPGGIIQSGSEGDHPDISEQDENGDESSRDDPGGESGDNSDMEKGIVVEHIYWHRQGESGKEYFIRLVCEGQRESRWMTEQGLGDVAADLLRGYMEKKGISTK